MSRKQPTPPPNRPTREELGIRDGESVSGNTKPTPPPAPPTLCNCGNPEPESVEFAIMETAKAAVKSIKRIKVGLLEIVPVEGREDNIMQPVKIFFDGVEQTNVKSIKLEGKSGELWTVTMERFTFKKGEPHDAPAN